LWGGGGFGCGVLWGPPPPPPPPLLLPFFVKPCVPLALLLLIIRISTPLIVILRLIRPAKEQEVRTNLGLMPQQSASANIVMF
jgi:hypothetical protein